MTEIKKTNAEAPKAEAKKAQGATPEAKQPVINVTVQAPANQAQSARESRAAYYAERDAEIEKEQAEQVQEFTRPDKAQNPPAHRATDGKPMGTKPENPLKLAEKAE